jgi:hypothetical protein
MKTTFFLGFVALILLFFFPSTGLADGGLARGAVPGELYVYGAGGSLPDWVDWLYRSTDSGQTVYLQNDTVSVVFLAEGVNAGELYKTSGSNIYHSDDFGVNFVQKGYIGPGVDLQAIASGYASGEVYASIYNITKYSTDYGDTFVDKGTCSGGVRCMSVGHSLGELYYGCFYGEVYYSDDHGETHELIVDLAYSIDIIYISSGSEDSEIYFFDSINYW